MSKGINYLLEIAAEIVDMFILNIMVTASSMFILTSGMSMAAMYSVLYQKMEDTGRSMVMDFFREWLSEARRCIPITVLLLLVAALLSMGTYASYAMGFLSSPIVLILFVLFWVVLATVWSWVFPMAARYRASVKETLLNAVYMVLRFWPVSLLLAAVNLLPLISFPIIPERYFSAYLFVLLFFGFTLPANINCRILVRCFDSMDRNTNEKE